MLSEIGGLTREIVRNGEEKLAITVGAYNSVSCGGAADSRSIGIYAFSISLRHRKGRKLQRWRKIGRRSKIRAWRSICAFEDYRVDVSAEPVYCYCRTVSYGEVSVYTRLTDGR